jgi:Flp pilus assembly protein TadG
MMHLPRISFIFRRRGTVAIEYAIILPVFLIMLLGIMDISRLLWTYTTLYRASEAAARCAAIKAASCTTFAATKAYAVTAALGLNITASSFSVSNPACGIQVSSSYDFRFIFPQKTVTLTTTACYPD